MDDILNSGYYESLLGYDILDMIVKKLKIKMVFYLENTPKDINITEEDEEQYCADNRLRLGR